MSGILIAPITTMYFDSGFMVSLKGFVGAIIGGLVSYPLAAAGAVLVGLIEAFSSFWASAYKEIVVFTLIIPVLLWRSLKIITSKRKKNESRFVLLAFLALLALAPPFLPPFYVTLLNYIGLYALVALGLVLLTGVGGLTSFGQAAFVGLGAYTTAILTTRADSLPSWLGWLAPRLADAAGRPAADAGGGLAAGRDHAQAVRPFPAAGHHRLGAVAVLRLWFDGRPGRTYRHSGHSRHLAVRQGAGPGRDHLLPDLGLPAAGGLVTRNLLDSREGRAIRALKGGRVMAESMGVDTARSRMVIFIIAALQACASGWLYAHMQRFVNRIRSACR